MIAHDPVCPRRLSTKCRAQSDHAATRLTCRAWTPNGAILHDQTSIRQRPKRCDTSRSGSGSVKNHYQNALSAAELKRMVHDWFRSPLHFVTLAAAFTVHGSRA